MSRHVQVLFTAVVVFGLGMVSPSAKARVAPESPTLAPPPHHVLKNRYISIDPRGESGTNPGSVDIRVTLTSTEVLGVPAIDSLPDYWANEPIVLPSRDPCLSILTTMRPASPPDWSSCPVVHLTGCPIIPTATYEIRIQDGVNASDPLFARTIFRPIGNKWWADTVGDFTGTEWTEPQGTVNFADVTAGLKTFQDPRAFNATHVSVSDIHPLRPDLGNRHSHPNGLVNIDDVFHNILAFVGDEYPGFHLEDCIDEEE